jgi:putative transposase
MARLPRFYIPGQPLHAIQRGNNREPIFGGDADFRHYLCCLEEAAEKHRLIIHSYVLMTNHVHLLATPSHETSLPKTMQSVGRRYVQYFNYSYGRTGTLWEGRYRSTLIDSDAYLLTCMRYIELNPVRALMVMHPADYRWSSYRANAFGEANDIVRPHETFLGLGNSDNERRTAYRQLFSGQLSVADVEMIRDATNRAWALGNDRFREKIEALSGRRSRPLPKGRPRNGNGGRGLNRV